MYHTSNQPTIIILVWFCFALPSLRKEQPVISLSGVRLLPFKTPLIATGKCLKERTLILRLLPVLGYPYITSSSQGGGGPFAKI